MIINYKKFNEGKKKFPNLKKMEVDGYQVLVGRDAASNDYLSTIQAKDDDVWFHVKGHPGSHVVIVAGETVVPNETKQKVAEIAVQHSKAKILPKVEVVCCKAKFVTKRKEMRIGQVSVDYNNADYFLVRN